MLIVGNRPTSRVDESTERLVRAILRGMDDLLDLLWVPNAVYHDERDAYDGRYALTCRWAQEDKRWEMYHSGEIGEPFDVLGWFTQAAGRGDFHEPESLPVDPMSIMDKVVEFLGRCDNSRQPWRERMREAMEANRMLRASRLTDQRDEIMEGMKYYRRMLSGSPLVNLNSGIGLGLVVSQDAKE